MAKTKVGYFSNIHYHQISDVLNSFEMSYASFSLNSFHFTGPRRDIETSDYIEDLQAQIRTLQSQNEQLKNKVIDLIFIVILSTKWLCNAMDFQTPRLQ